ncbi:MAG TPA: helix-turn-helix transcriptional regulator [Hyphomicrobiaceae bacterium]|jgi:transcriptional regulator with XRE-family HTH domain|nr:helix-turn-helix transcriptional regulator [Hyphomicrobiaceae bacterium]
MAMRSTDGRHQAALSLIKTAMIEKKLTQAELADAADCHEKTIQNLLSGRSVRDQTLFDVCMVLGLDFDKVKGTWSGGQGEMRDAPEGNGAHARVAPVYMGAYSREAVDHYLGSYLTLRPSFSVPGGIMAYRTDITWDDEWPSLVFQERDRPDKPFLHRGRLYIPASSMFIHLVSLTKGAMRMVMVSQLDLAGQMRGLVTTLHKQRALFMPVSAPIVYAKREDFGQLALGEISCDQSAYGGYQAMLTETIEQGYARLIGA